MKDPHIPVKLKARNAVAKRVALVGSVPIAELPRLVEALASAEGELQIRLQFAEHHTALGRVTGTITGNLWLTCQRSMEPFLWPLSAQFDWALVGDEEHEEKLLADTDPVMLEDENLLLRQSLEDEVLLTLPLMAIAPEGSSKRQKPGSKTKAPAISDNIQLDDTRPNPFALLKGQFPKH